MKAISLKPPWHWAILEGHKPVENRTWRTDYRGPLLIHVSKTWDPDGWKFIWNLGLEAPGRKETPFGCIVGSVDVLFTFSSDHTLLKGPWVFGPWCWQLANPRWLPEPIPWHGKLGLFDVSDEIIHSK